MSVNAVQPPHVGLAMSSSRPWNQSQSFRSTPAARLSPGSGPATPATTSTTSRSASSGSPACGSSLGPRCPRRFRGRGDEAKGRTTEKKPTDPEPAMLDLLPNEGGEVIVTFRPPRTWETPAGRSRTAFSSAPEKRTTRTGPSRGSRSSRRACSRLPSSQSARRNSCHAPRAGASPASTASQSTTTATAPPSSTGSGPWTPRTNWTPISRPPRSSSSRGHGSSRRSG